MTTGAGFSCASREPKATDTGAEKPVKMASGRSSDPTPEELAHREQEPKGRRRTRTILHMETRVVEAPAPTGTVRIEGARGAIRVTGADRPDLRAEAEVAAATVERLSAAVPVIEPGDNGGVRVRIAWPDERQTPEAVSWTVDTPRTIRAVGIEAIKTEVSLRDVSGDAEVRTTDGQVVIVNQAGAVEVGTSNARISIDAPGGAVSAGTTNAGIEVYDARASVDAVTINGAIRVRLAGSASPGMMLRTERGAILLEIGEGYTGTIDIETGPDGLDVDPGVLAGGALRPGAPGVRTLTIGAGGQRSTIVASQGGTVRIARRQ